MGVFAKKGDQEEPGGGGGAGLHLDLEQRYCVSCRRAVQPWETTCPVDGERVVALSELPSAMPPPPAHLLDADDDDQPEDDGPQG
jgi:hypothetical protein